MIVRSTRRNTFEVVRVGPAKVLSWQDPAGCRLAAFEP